MIILATIHPPLTPEVNIDEALLEQESVFSDCEYDADGIPVDPAKRSLDSMQVARLSGCRLVLELSAFALISACQENAPYF